jgi:hypothetical protein
VYVREARGQMVLSIAGEPLSLPLLLAAHSASVPSPASLGALPATRSGTASEPTHRQSDCPPPASNRQAPRVGGEGTAAVAKRRRGRGYQTEQRMPAHSTSTRRNHTPTTAPRCTSPTAAPCCTLPQRCLPALRNGPSRRPTSRGQPRQRSMWRSSASLRLATHMRVAEYC